MTEQEPTDTLPFTQKKVGNYHLTQQIGKGTFSIVALGIHIPTKHKVAVKILQKSKIQDQTDIERINREIVILKMISHPHLAKLYETITTKNNIYLVMPYISGGDLFDYILEHTKLSEDTAKMLFAQIVSCMEYLNKLNICHRDIKPENILLNNNKDYVTMIDFGLSNFCSYSKLLQSSCGSPCYASPEMIKGEPYNGIISDVWSCGVVLYSMLVGCLPFDDDDLQRLYNKIIKGDFVLPSYLSSEAIDLLKQMLVVDVNKRITVSKIKKHKWMRDCPCVYRRTYTPHKQVNAVDKDIAHVIKAKFFGEDKDVTEKTICNSVMKKCCDKYSAFYYLYIESNGLKQNGTKKSRTLSRNKNKTKANEVIKVDRKERKVSNNINNHHKAKDLNVFVINNIFSSNNNRPKGRNNQTQSPTTVTTDDYLSNAYSNITHSSNQSKLLSPSSIHEMNKLKLIKPNLYHQYTQTKDNKAHTPVAMRQKHINMHCSSNNNNNNTIHLRFDSSFGKYRHKYCNNISTTTVHSGIHTKNITPKRQRKSSNINVLNEDKPLVNLSLTYNNAQGKATKVEHKKERCKLKEVDINNTDKNIGDSMFKPNLQLISTLPKSSTKHKEQNKQLILKKLLI